MMALLRGSFYPRLQEEDTLSGSGIPPLIPGKEHREWSTLFLPGC